MKQTFHCLALTVGLTVGALSGAHAAGFMDNLKQAAGSQLSGSSASGSTSSGGASSLLGGLGLPSLSSGGASNAAGVLGYCIKNKYLSASSADGIKSSLMGKLGLGSEQQAQQDQGYQSGLAGMLKGSDGSSFSLENVQSQLKTKACDYVLDNAKSWL